MYAPWLEKSINPCNGSMFFLLELAACSNCDPSLRWLIVIPLVLGFVYTCIMPDEQESSSQHSKGIAGKRAEVVYTILCHSVLIAGIASPLEAEFQSWGYMTSIPCLVLMMMVMEKWMNTWIIYLLAFIFVFLGHTVDDYKPPVPGDPWSMLLMTSATLLSTPVFGSKRKRRIEISLITSIWYILIYCVYIRKVPSLATWMAIPMLTTSAMTLCNSFKEFDPEYKFAFATATVLLGIGISGSGSFEWWTKFIFVVIIGIMRMFWGHFSPFSDCEEKKEDLMFRLN